MVLRIALVGGHDPRAAEFVGRHDPEGSVDALLHAALRCRGVDLLLPNWSDESTDWSGLDLAVVRTTWDYAQQRAAFVAWAARTETTVPLENPAEVLRWNTHKSYLIELEERGAPVVPTAWLAQGDAIALAELLDHRDWVEAVIKPAVGAGSDGIVRVSRDDAIGLAAAQVALDRLLARGDVMVQPFRSGIARGELSLVFIAGELSHVVRKLPAPGEFRIQGRFGGRYVQEQAATEPVALAQWVLEATGAAFLFARVDLIESDDGGFELSEVEATEPDLYLALADDAADRLADAIVKRANGTNVTSTVSALADRASAAVPLISSQEAT
jgi:glutathione synthase/RimK-type ligase-like ATP-grasp enzyme